jgi:hypothetical protein
MKNEILTILAITYLSIITAVWCICVFLVFQIIKNRKEDVHLWFDTYLNPFNLIFLSSKLNDKGNKYQYKLFMFAGIFTILISLSMVFVVLFKY